MRKLTQEKFIEKIKQVHGNKYDYSLVKYKTMRNKIKVICTEHGEFEILAAAHKEGQGCKKCSIKKVKEKLSLSNFKEKAKKIHGDRYNYSLVEYKNNKTKVKIICPKHGVFKQIPNSHLLGFGCPKCGVDSRMEKTKHHPRGWSYKNWEKRGVISENFDSFKVYVLYCWNDEEEFYKIGKTFRSIKNRFYTDTLLPYNYKIVKVIEGTAKEMSNLEKKLQKEHKDFAYLPKINFDGMQECFTNFKNN